MPHGPRAGSPMLVLLSRFTDRRRFNSARARTYALEEQRREAEAKRRRADFYEPVATGIFKSAAEIAFLERRARRRSCISAKGNLLRSRLFSLRFKALPGVALSPELSTENARFVRTGAPLRAPLSPERASGDRP